ncbi:hypothetical protein ACWAU3_09370 [Shewanella sp. JL219SE-S6]
MLCEARRLLALIVFLSLGLTGCYDPQQTKAQTPPQDGYPVCITTAHGTSCIESPPKRVVTLGAGAEDWTLSLGLSPSPLNPITGEAMQRVIYPGFARHWKRRSCRCPPSSAVTPSWMWSDYWR